MHEVLRIIHCDLLICGTGINGKLISRDSSIFATVPAELRVLHEGLLKAVVWSVDEYKSKTPKNYIEFYGLCAMFKKFNVSLQPIAAKRMRASLACGRGMVVFQFAKMVIVHAVRNIFVKMISRLPMSQPPWFGALQT